MHDIALIGISVV